NRKVCIKLANSRGKIFNSAMPGGADGLVLARAENEICAGCRAVRLPCFSRQPGGGASDGRGGRSNGRGGRFARPCPRGGTDADRRTHRFFRARRAPLSIPAAALHGP